MKYLLLFLLVPMFAVADNLPVTYECSTPNCAFPDGIQAILGGITEDVGTSGAFIHQYAQLTDQITTALYDLPAGSPFRFNGQVSWSDPITLPSTGAGYGYAIQMTTWGGDTYGTPPNVPNEPLNGDNYVGLSINGNIYTFGCNYHSDICPLAFDGTIPPNTQVSVIGDLSWGCGAGGDPCIDILSHGPYGSINNLDIRSDIVITSLTPELFSCGLVVSGLALVGLVTIRRRASKS